MTQNEWQILCRITKNNGTYYQLQWSVKHYVKSPMFYSNYRSDSVNVFIERYRLTDIFKWYLTYYKGKNE